MMTLNDGRSELWQWDTGRKLAVGADCTQVHFSNKFFGRSIDVDVFDGTAEIPDVLLQVDKDLFVWAFVGTAENGYTKISKVFKVNKRNKPADYVFTPPEQTTLDEIMERLDRIEESQDPDAIKNAVDEYLANNPIQVKEKDPTVPDWAKQPTKPKYTAQEVGAVATVNGTAPDKNGNVEIDVPEGGTGSGLTTAQINALHGMFKVCLFDDSKDVDSAIAAFEAAFGLSGGEEEPDEPDIPDVPVVKTYSVFAELINVTSSNKATTVDENASYTTTLTAADGYKLDTVSVLMDGVDVTADVYADGVISIPAVTGNVEIVASAVGSGTGDDSGTETAELNTDGLLGFFDFRNKAASSGNGSTGYYESATVGDGRLYAWYSKGAGNEYGKYASSTQFCSGASYTVHDFGTEFTWILKAYCDALYTLPGANDYMTPTNFGVSLAPKYNTSSGTATATATAIGQKPAGYHTVTMKASDSVLQVYVDAALVAEYDGADIDSFVSWYGKFTANAMWASGQTVLVHTAMAFYDRALTDVEIVEMDEYLKTLEVA